jgi:hypothetical protein
MAKVIQTKAIQALPMNKWLIVLLLLTIVATVWTALHEDNNNASAELELQHVASKMQQSPKSGASLTKVNQLIVQAKIASNSSSQFIPWQKLKREPSKVVAYDLFKVHSWLVAPPVKKVKPAPPPAPVAPSVPFVYLGKLENTPSTQIFLMANNKLYTVTKGENIDQQWRLDAEDGELLRLTYLPLSLQQTLSKFAKPAVAQPEIAADIN